VAEAANVADGLHAIRHMAPQLVFLDVSMPDGTGFDLLAALERAPAVIFTTAHDQFALRAFDANALDYLLKPIEAARLAQALQKAGRDAPAAAPKATDGKVFIQDGERCWFVDVDQIVLFESEGNYTRVYFGSNRPLLLRSLSQLEERLDPQQFTRVSRRHIVNLRYVQSVGPSPAGGLVLQLEGGLNVDMSRRRAVEFKQLNRL
jgi:two-component system LytT family response regulator